MKFCAGFVLAVAGLASAKFWMEEIAHQGRSPYFPDLRYQVFRNVKDWGAVGDGVTDDTDAINAAITEGGRCAPGVCKGSTLSPATVYIPAGIYLISDSIVDLFYTQIIGDPTSRPVIKAAGTFPRESFGLIDGNPYLPNGGLAWNSTNTFFRQIRNLVIDTTALPPDFPAVGIHWPSSQATSITNCVFQLSELPGNRHTGLWIEEGSGGLLNDLYFYGGGNATVLGNQQYTARNLWFFQCDVALMVVWNWGWTFKSIFVRNCRVGIHMSADTVGSVTLLDSLFENVGIGIATTRLKAGALGSGGTLAMENTQFVGVNSMVAGLDGIELAGVDLTQGNTDAFIMGHFVDSMGFFDHSGYYNTTTGQSPPLLEGKRYYEKSKPQYEQVPVQNFYSARQFGAVGDGSHDDTQALNTMFAWTALNGSVAFLDAGLYSVTDTVYIPAGARIVGEALASIIMATGPNFQDMGNPRPVVQVGQIGDVGRIEWLDTIVATRGPCAGAVLIQFHLFSNGAPSGMWDVHTRIGGFTGTDLQVSECPTRRVSKDINARCIAAYMSMYITPSAGGLFMENNWFWVADHDIENQKYKKVAVYAGRGLLVASRQGRIWLSATGSEHHVLYQYQFINTKDIYIGHAQTEEAYFQPEPGARYPFPATAFLSDPDFQAQCQSSSTPRSCDMGWGMRIVNSTDVVVYGAGLYSFFNNYNDTCASNKIIGYCQDRILSVEGSVMGTRFLGLSTVGAAIMVQRDGVDMVPAYPNNSTFADTLALYRP